MKVLGGQVTMAASAPHRGDIGAITSWLAGELEALQVDVHLNSVVDADLVVRVAPDEVVIASGTTPRGDGFQVSTPAVTLPGFDLPHVYSSWDLLGFGNPVKMQGPAVVFDDTGTFEAISAVDVLLKAGLPVTLVSRLSGIGETLPYPPVTAGAARERLMNGDFDFIGDHYLRSISEEEVEIGVLFTERVRRLPAKTVIMVGYNEPNRGLAVELADSGVPVHLIGDVRGRNSIMTAIHGAAELGRRI
jgi:hypothetical protein